MGLAVLLTVEVVDCRAADEVLSGNVREADNKTGQNTNTGSGIKTNHIQNSAVTSAKIKDGNVVTADLANGAVTSAKIKDGNIFTADLANGAVSASKIGFYSRVIIVDGNGGGDFTSPVAAMASITDASASNPYLVKIMPGVYDVGVNALTMKAHVDIEGSGENVTTIQGSVTATDPPATALAVGASNAEIRFLRLSNTNVATSISVGFLTPAGASPSLLHVTVVAAGNGTAIGAYNSADSRPALNHVTVEAQALPGSEGARTYGIYSRACSPELTDVLVSALGGSASNVGIAHFGSGLIAPAVLRRVAVVADGEGSDATLGTVGIQVAYDPGVQVVPVRTIELYDVVASSSGLGERSAGITHVGAGASVMSNVTARGMYGMDNSGEVFGVADSILIRAERSSFDGTLASIRTGVEHRVDLAWSKLVGPPAITTGGTLRCVDSLDGNYTALAVNCAP